MNAVTDGDSTASATPGTDSTNGATNTSSGATNPAASETGGSSSAPASAGSSNPNAGDPGASTSPATGMNDPGGSGGSSGSGSSGSGSSGSGSSGSGGTAGSPPTGDDPSAGAGGSGGLSSGGPEMNAGGNAGQDGSAGQGGQGAGGSAAEVPGNASSANYPFPQNRDSAYCVYASNYDNADVQAAYDSWKETVVTADGAGGFLRVRKPDSGTVIGSTVSEGIGYGMLLAVYMDDQPVFDGLWQYAMRYFNGNGLMEWEIDPNGTVIGTGAALDGDEDMGWALVMADRQWGGSGSSSDSYLNYAVALIDAMWEHEIDHSRGEMPLPGDAWGGADITNISYYAPAYYRLFAEVTDNPGWLAAIDRSYEILNLSLRADRGNLENGLVPAWCDSNGVPTAAYDGAPLHFQNDSTRTPFRVGQDYCYYGEPRARAYMEKITSFYTSVGVENIVDGYELDGTPRPDFAANGLLPASFVGPAGVGAMYSDAHLAFIDEAYAALATGELTAGTIYYQKSWTALSLLMLTGNFTELPPP